MLKGFVAATISLCDELEPTLGLFATRTNEMVEAWVDELICRILVKSDKHRAITDFVERLISMSQVFRNQAKRYCLHIKSPYELTASESFMKAERRERRIFEGFGCELVSAAQVFDEAVIVAKFLANRSASRWKSPKSMDR
jgi:hypothetical protein